MSDFQSFGEILHLGKLKMSITQKVHGTNGQIYIYQNENNEWQIKAGNRTRWLTLEEDNFGFAKYVEENKEEIIQKLGKGRHFGEWCGPLINSGEGLKENNFVLFNWERWNKKPLPCNMLVIPIIYVGKLSFEIIQERMDFLKEKGSRLVPGYMSPEGIVIQVGESFFKKVFKDEETSWKQVAHLEKMTRENIDVAHLLQPIRLEKLLSRDEKYLRNYPESLSDICKDYVLDLEKEEQIKGTPEEVKIIKRVLGHILYPFVIEIINER